MKKVLGLDLGTGSIGWAVVNEAETENETSSIVRLGVRVNPLTVDEQAQFESGKPITTNAERTQKRAMRRNLQRYKLRRENLIEILKQQGWIDDETILSEQGNNSTFETYRLRAKAASEEITLEQLARVLLMINKKRGYKSSRKAKGEEDGFFVDSLDVARQMYDEGLTPGQYGCRLLSEGKHLIPDFYRSDLQSELDKIWTFQLAFHPDILTADLRKAIDGMSGRSTSAELRKRFGIFTMDIKGKKFDRNKALYSLRNDALRRELNKEELATVICDINGQINGSSGYLGAISDRSKELYINHKTIGQKLIESLDKDPNVSLRNQPFYRRDYLDEFEQIWETQAGFHPELTDELKHEIRDVVIFYQRRLKSQKWLVSNCPFENRKVSPKSSPLFQHFRIWQTLNNVVVRTEDGEFPIDEDQKQMLFDELLYKEKISKTEALKILFSKTRGFDLNFATLEGNRTMASLLKAAGSVVELSGHGEWDFAKMPSNDIVSTVRGVFNGLGFDSSWLDFDSSKQGEALDREPQYRLWHLLYSFEGDNSATGDEKLVERLMELLKMPKEYARLFAGVKFEDDYGSLSVKAIQKILPFMAAGHVYSEACALAGYRHSAQSLTRDEIDNRQLKDHLEQLPKNSLRNPVVEKILNQMVNVVNGVIDAYGRPDEVRIELARELKKNSAERQAMADAVSKNTKETERIKALLQKEFGLTHVSRNDIVRYRLYQELETNGFKTLYSNEYISREDLFSKKIDIEHIIPQARLFDDSFSNKTLELREVNIEKGNATAMDYVKDKYGPDGAAAYKARIDALFQKGAISPAKAKKLKMTVDEIPSDFIERDLRNTQYISRKAQEMLRDIARTVTATTGSITDRLRNDWQLVDIMQELNWEKFERQGLTQVIIGRDGQRIRRIDNWTKRNDHRHHAMDALTIAFTKPAYINYLNHLNARDKDDIRAIERRFLERDGNGHLRFKSPIEPNFRSEAKRHLEMILVSIKAKNKVVTRNTNTTKSKNGNRKKIQLTPRGALHKETVYGCINILRTKPMTVGSKMTAEEIAKVQNPSYRKALQTRLDAFGGDPKKAFTGKNSLEKNPIWLDEKRSQCVPDTVTIQWYEPQPVIRKLVDKDLKIDKVLDLGVRRLLEDRLNEFGGDAAKAFSNLENNPIWLNREKGIKIKRVTIAENYELKPLHHKHDKDGKMLLDADGKPIPADYVNLRNNHHSAIFIDADGNIQEHLVSFYKAVARVVELGLPVIDREYNKDKGWQFLFTMKQNEYFVFPNPSQGFDPNEIDLLDERNYARISPNLYRVQKMSNKDYVFRHHLETTVEDTKELQGITWKRVKALNNLNGIVKVRVDHIGRIVKVGEY